MLEELLSEFVALWVVIDPIGTVPVFLAATRGMPTPARRRVAKRAVLASAAILTFFLVVGELLLDAMGVSLLSFQIAGGIVLFLFALTMVFGPSKPASEMQLVDESEFPDPSIYPLAVPSLAGPGSMMSVVLLTDNDRHARSEQLVTWILLVGVLAATWLLLRAAEGVHRVLGEAGASVVSRVMGLILASLAADAVLSGVRDYFALG